MLKYNDDNDELTLGFMWNKTENERWEEEEKECWNWETRRSSIYFGMRNEQEWDETWISLDGRMMRVSEILDVSNLCMNEFSVLNMCEN